MPSAERVTVPAPAILVDHTHPSPHILVVLDGELWEDGRAYRAGDLRLSRADDRHFLRFAGSARCLVIEADTVAGLTASRRVLRVSGLSDRVRRAESAAEAVALVSAFARNTPALDLEPPAWLAELESRRARGEFVSRSRVGRIARLAGVSREHLARSYQRYFGLGIGDALRSRQLRRAYDAITGTTRPLADIADASGFADQSHMTRQFARWIGVTPWVLRHRRQDITFVQDVACASAVQLPP